MARQRRIFGGRTACHRYVELLCLNGNLSPWSETCALQFRFLPRENLPEGAKIGTSCKLDISPLNEIKLTYTLDTTLILKPDVFLPWFRTKLEKSGVKFKRMDLKSLSDARKLGHDILVNATGLGSLRLQDVQDQDLEMIRGQTVVVKSSYNKLLMHDNDQTYTYAIPRLDGTVVLGGTRQKDSV